MTNEAALRIISQMAEGIDPMTVEVLPDEHLCNNGQVIRALYAARHSLERRTDAPKRERQSPPPSPKRNAGRPWTQEDNEQLRGLYRDGMSVDYICYVLSRRPRGVDKQLRRLGLSPAAKEHEKEAVSGLERAGKPWTEAEDALLQSLYDKRQTVEEMAA